MSMELMQITNVADVFYFIFRKGIAVDRLVGFQDMGGKDDFTTKTLEALLIKKGIVLLPIVFFISLYLKSLVTIISQALLTRRETRTTKTMKIMKVQAEMSDPPFSLILILINIDLPYLKKKKG